MDDGLLQAMLKDDQKVAEQISAMEARVRELEEREQLIVQAITELQGQRDLDVTRIADLERRAAELKLYAELEGHYTNGRREL